MSVEIPVEEDDSTMQTNNINDLPPQEAILASKPKIKDTSLKSWRSPQAPHQQEWRNTNHTEFDEWTYNRPQLPQRHPYADGWMLPSPDGPYLIPDPVSPKCPIDLEAEQHEKLRRQLQEDCDRLTEALRRAKENEAKEQLAKEPVAAPKTVSLVKELGTVTDERNLLAKALQEFLKGLKCEHPDIMEQFRILVTGQNAAAFNEIMAVMNAAAAAYDESVSEES